MTDTVCRREGDMWSGLVTPCIYIIKKCIEMFGHNVSTVPFYDQNADGVSLMNNTMSFEVSRPIIGV